MKIVLVDERISESCLRALRLRGFFPIALPKHPRLPKAIASHPDSLLFYAEGVLFTPAEYCEFAPAVFSDIREYLPHIKISFTSDTLGEKYPEDARMNAKLIEKNLLVNRRTVSEAILAFAKERGYKMIDTNQGYPACTTLVAAFLAVTADAGIKSALAAESIDTLLIENGDIALPPYGYGFIGGASGVYKDQVFFIGDFKKHKSCDIIERELKTRGYTPVSLSDEPLRDLGGLVFLE